MARKFNFIYKKLVEKEGDMVGHIAYSLYKKQKIAFIEKWRSEHENAYIPEDVLENFHTAASTDESINDYRRNANAILQRFTSGVLDKEAKNIQKQCVENQVRTLVTIVEKMKPKPTSWKTQYFHGASQSALGSLLFALFIAIISFIIYYGGGSLPITISFGDNSAKDRTEQVDSSHVSNSTNISNQNGKPSI